MRRLRARVMIGRLFYDATLVAQADGVSIFYQKNPGDPALMLRRCNDDWRTECFRIKRLASGDQIIRVPFEDDLVTRGVDRPERSLSADLQLTQGPVVPPPDPPGRPPSFFGPRWKRAQRRCARAWQPLEPGTSVAGRRVAPELVRTRWGGNTSRIRAGFSRSSAAPRDLREVGLRGSSELEALP